MRQIIAIVLGRSLGTRSSDIEITDLALAPEFDGSPALQIQFEIAKGEAFELTPTQIDSTLADVQKQLSDLLVTPRASLIGAVSPLIEEISRIRFTYGHIARTIDK